MSMEDNLYPEVRSVVWAMWDEEPEEIVSECVTRFCISSDYAWDLVSFAIQEEIEAEKDLDEGDDGLFDWDGDALASCGWGMDEDY